MGASLANGLSGFGAGFGLCCHGLIGSSIEGSIGGLCEVAMTSPVDIAGSLCPSWADESTLASFSMLGKV